MKEQLETAISGSFKFKPEIDELHEHFADLNVTVLEPTKGWLYIPSGRIEYPAGFRPLPTERGMGIGEIENRFMRAIDQSDFLYVYNPGGYLGLSMAMEIAHAMFTEKPIFALNEIGVENFEGELGMYYICRDYIKVATPEEAVATVQR